MMIDPVIGDPHWKYHEYFPSVSWLVPCEADRGGRLQMGCLPEYRHVLLSGVRRQGI